MNMDVVESAIGNSLGDRCHKLSYCKKIGLKKIEQFDSENA